jgi:hypothetical protein
MVMTTRGSFTGSENNSTTNIPQATMTVTTILITYATSTTQYYLLLLSDLYDVENDSLNEYAIGSIMDPICL